MYVPLLILALGQTVPARPVQVAADLVSPVRTGGTCLIKNGTVITVTGPILPRTDVLVRNGKIERIAADIPEERGMAVLDATGKFLTPGLVDAHSHRGQSEVNEWGGTAVPEVRVGDVLDSDLKGLWDDLSNGITTGLVLHGSANAIGGQSVVIKHRYKAGAPSLVFQGAPRMVKFALGENVSTKLDDRGTRFPTSRAGVESVYRRAFTDARAYMRRWDEWDKAHLGTPPRRDLRLEALGEILKGDIWVQCHSYRGDEILMMARLSQEFGFKLGAMQHALEAYKVAPELAKAGVPASMFSDAWDYKVEVFEAIPMGVSLCVRAGVLSSVNTDSFSGMAPLNIDAAKTMRYGVSEAEAIKLVTLNPARQLGVDKWVGSLEPGKDADIGVWDGHPLSVYSKCAMTLVDGEVVFKRRDAFGLDRQGMAAKSVRPSRLVADLSQPEPEREAFALVGATLHPVSRAAIASGVVLVKGSRIVAVGDSATPIPSGFVRVDLSGKHVYPGFIDAGSDIGLNEVGSVKSMRDDQENGPFQPDLRFLTSINVESVKFPIARCAGVTSAFVRPSGRGLVMGNGAVVTTAGWTREDMVVGDGMGLCVAFPPGIDPQARLLLPAAKLEEQEKSVATNREALKEYFKGAARYRAARLAGLVEEDAQLGSLVPALEGTRRVFVFAQAEETIREALAWTKEAGLKMVLVGGADAWKVASELMERSVPVILGAPSTSCPWANQPFGAFDPYDTRLATPALLARAGVKFCLQGGDSSSVMNLPWSAGMTVAYGLAHDEAVRAITLGPAEILGVGTDLGSLDVGKLANIVVVDGDPLEVTTQTEKVWVRGKPQVLKSKFTELYRKYERRLSE